MFDVFGEFNSFDEINETAEGLFNEGDMESLQILAKENGIPEEIVGLYVEGEMPVLCDVQMAAVGKIEVMEAVYGEHCRIVRREKGGKEEK